MPCKVVGLSGTESAILNRESGDSELCDSNGAIPTLSFFSLVFLFPWRFYFLGVFLAGNFLGPLECFLLIVRDFKGPPTPLGSFCKGRGGGGRRPKRHLGPDPHLGVLEFGT